MLLSSRKSGCVRSQVSKVGAQTLAGSQRTGSPVGGVSRLMRIPFERRSREMLLVLIPSRTFQTVLIFASNLPTIAAKEPHLLAAILTVASKDESDWMTVHEACSAHMRHCIADLVYSGIGSVEAVEAMLILAEWVPRRPHSTPASTSRGKT